MIIMIIFHKFCDEIDLRVRYPLDMHSSVLECVCEWVSVCVFLREFLHFGHCKLLYCFGSIFIFSFFLGGIFFFLSSFYLLLFSFCFLFVILFYFGIFSSCLFCFLFPSFFSSIVSLRDEIAGEGDFFHSCNVKGYKECLSVCLSIGQENQEQEETSEAFLVTRI